MISDRNGRRGLWRQSCNLRAEQMGNQVRWLYRVNGKCFGEWSPPDTPACSRTERTPVNVTSRLRGFAVGQPRVVCWCSESTLALAEREDEHGVVWFVPSSGPDWQGRHGRRPRLLERGRQVGLLPAPGKDTVYGTAA